MSLVYSDFEFSLQASAFRNLHADIYSLWQSLMRSDPFADFADSLK